MNKFFKKNKKIIYTLVVILIVVGFVVLSNLAENSSKALTTDAQENIVVLEESIPNDEYSVVVIGLTYCSHCHNFNPVITKISGEYNLPLYWFDIDALAEEDATKLSEAFEAHGYEGSSPYIAVLKKGEVVSTHVGEMGRDNTLSFLKEAEAIK